MKIRTQTKDVLNYLKEHEEGISSMEAWELFHITRLADVIFKLRKRGHNIVTEIKIGNGVYGFYTYAVYRLEEE